MPDVPKEALQLDQQLCFAVYSTALAFTKTYKPLLDPLGLTYPQYLVMLVLWERDDLTVKEIGTLLHLDSGTLTPLLKRLEAAGHLRRERDAQDERQVRITLTPPGRALHDKAAEIVPAGLACAIEWDLPDIRKLRTDLERLRAQLGRSL